MKVTILSKEMNKEIDWDKNNILVHKELSDFIVLANGEHDDDEFHGTIINYEDPSYIGAFDTELLKSSFKLPNNPITITFENE